MSIQGRGKKKLDNYKVEGTNQRRGKGLFYIPLVYKSRKQKNHSTFCYTKFMRMRRRLYKRRTEGR